jgi:hypothetical protein
VCVCVYIYVCMHVCVCVCVCADLDYTAHMRDATDAIRPRTCERRVWPNTTLTTVAGKVAHYSAVTAGRKKLERMRGVSRRSESKNVRQRSVGRKKTFFARMLEM